MWKFLSYPLTKELSSYKNGKRINISYEKKICNADPCNQSKLEFSTHLGTHIDFPYHFDDKGKRGDEYVAEEFIFLNPEIIFIEKFLNKTSIIEVKHFKNIVLKKETDFLIIKTGYCKNRFEEKYYNNYPGFSEELAKYFKSQCPKLRAIGFDLISLSSPLNGDLGRKAHIEFLKNEKLLIVEDMDLNIINDTSKLNMLILAPLRFEGCDGAPVTIFFK